eukprot:11201661-Lingulodinium_polyedra.AAC.1
MVAAATGAKAPDHSKAVHAPCGGDGAGDERIMVMTMVVVAMTMMMMVMMMLMMMVIMMDVDGGRWAHLPAKRTMG